MARKTTSISASFKKTVPSEKCVWNKEGAPKADKGTSGSNKKSEIVSSSHDVKKTADISNEKNPPISAKVYEGAPLREVKLSAIQNMKAGAVGPNAITKKATAFLGEKNIPVREVFEQLGWRHLKENTKMMNYLAENAALIARVSCVTYDTSEHRRKKVLDCVEHDYLLNKIDQTQNGESLSSTISALQYSRAIAEAENNRDIMLVYIDKKHLMNEKGKLVLA